MPTDSPCIALELIAEVSRVGKALLTKNQTIITVESCTAGLLFAALAQVKGASDFLHGAFVTYTKDQKALALGVPEKLLQTSGSVNEAVAVAFAKGGLERSKADFGLAITGVLGPEPDEDGNPVGLVYIACVPRKGPTQCSRHYYGERHHEWIRRHVIRDACELALGTISVV